MKLFIELAQKKYAIEVSQPLDISIPMHSGTSNPNAFGIQPPLFEPYKAGGFIGSVAMGGSVNCENLFLNAHGNGTHTECIGHISKERISINSCLKQFIFSCEVISAAPEQISNGDFVITLKKVQEKLVHHLPEAIAIRSLPNNESKKQAIYSGYNPPYLEAELCSWLRVNGVKHLLIDMPSVDKEEDGGALASHHAFWDYPLAKRYDATITEMIFLPDSISDGLYLLNLQIASLETDASPSKPVLYKLQPLEA